MADDTTTPETDTVDTSAPEEGHAPAGEQTIDWEQRYNSLRPEFDRTKQSLSEHEQRWNHLTDPQTRAEALQELGLEIADEEDDDTPDYVDPYEELRGELDALKAERAQDQTRAQEEAHAAAVADFIWDETEKIESETGYELDDEEKHILATRAQQLQAANKAQAPMVREAWEALTGLYAKAHKRKPRPPAGRPLAGQSASKQPDLSNTGARADYIDSRLHANEQ